MKKCTKCDKIKNKEFFNKNKTHKDGFRSECKSCQSIYRINYHKLNLEKSFHYRKNNKERIDNYNNLYYKKNKDKINNYGLIYARNNPARFSGYAAKRKAIKIKATPKWLTEDHWNQIELFYVEAAKLTRETGIPHEVDHIEPLQGKEVCGLHAPWNLQILTESENRSKNNRTR